MPWHTALVALPRTGVERGCGARDTTSAAPSWHADFMPTRIAVHQQRLLLPPAMMLHWCCLTPERSCLARLPGALCAHNRQGHRWTKVSCRHHRIRKSYGDCRTYRPVQACVQSPAGFLWSTWLRHNLSPRTPSGIHLGCCVCDCGVAPHLPSNALCGSGMSRRQRTL